MFGADKRVAERMVGQNRRLSEIVATYLTELESTRRKSHVKGVGNSLLILSASTGVVECRQADLIERSTRSVARSRRASPGRLGTGSLGTTRWRR